MTAINTSPAGRIGALAAPPSSPARGAWLRFRRHRLALFGLFIVAGFALTALAAPLIAPQDPNRQVLSNTLSPPSGAHWFGTDELGRDQFSRVVFGARVSLVVGVTAIVATVLIGVALGTLAGYRGRAWDTVIMRTADVLFAFPLLIGAVVIVLVTGRGVLPVIAALALFGWATVARLLRGSILAAREAEYVEAARSLGAGGWRVATRHLLPNTLAPVLVYATIDVAAAIVAESELSFLGIGVKPGVADWGTMIASGQLFFGYKDYLWLLPSLAVTVVALGFILVGDGLRQAFDPRLR